MPNFPVHYLCQFGGSLRGDIWCCNIRFVNDGFEPLSNEEQQAKAEDLAGKIKTWMFGAGSGWSTFALMEYVKFNKIQASGAYADENATNVFVVSPPGAGGATESVSNHDALCVSWMTDANRGLASKGRIFIPAPATHLSGSTGRISPTDALAVANQAATFLNNANDDPNLEGWNLNASVVSGGKTGTPGLARKITGVRVGDIMDSMQSRRNALTEAYSTATVAIA